MCPRSHRLQILSVSVFLLGVIVGVAAEQAPLAQPTGDGLLRSELALGGRTAILAYPPDLKATDPAHKALLSAGTGAATARVRVGQLETTGSLRIGTVELRRDTPGGPQPAGAGAQGPAAAGTPAPVAVRYDLWLEGANNGWQLQVTDANKALVGQIPLAREMAAPASPTFVAALIPEDVTIGRLVLRWGDYQATSDVQFTNPSRRRIEENRVPNVTTNRTHDEDTSVLSRARLLAQRNETAFVLPKGQRLSISFERTFPRGERPGGDQNRRGLGVDGPDFARLATTAEGAIVMLTESSVPRLRTEVSLRFGKTVVATGNQVPGFPGSYGIWLKRAGSGWRLVFNHEPDAWGSQHDPKFDAAEIPLMHTGGHAAARPFAVALTPGGADRGRLVVIWGPHEWTADFVAIQ
jgi:hypothetical protein